MSSAPAARTWWQRRRRRVHSIVWPLAAFLATAGVLRWLLPARPHLVLPDDQAFVAFSKDSRTLITARRPAGEPGSCSAYDGPIRLWEIETGRERSRLADAEHGWQLIVFSPDDRVVATKTAVDLKLWDVATGRPLAEFPMQAHHTVVYPESNHYFSFSPDDNLLAYIVSQGNDWRVVRKDLTTVKIWDIDRGREKAAIHDVLWFGPLLFSPDGRTLAVTSLQGETGKTSPTVKLWDVAKTGERAVLQAQPSLQRERQRNPFVGSLYVRSLAFTPDGRALASGTSGDGLNHVSAEVKFWDATSGRERATIEGHPAEIAVLQFDAGGRDLDVHYGYPTGHHSGYHKLYDLSSQPPRPVRDAFDGPFVFRPGRTRMATTEGVQGIAVLDLGGKEATELRRIDEDGAALTPMAFSPDGRVLAVRISYPLRTQEESKLWGDHRVELIDVDRGRRLAWFRGDDSVETIRSDRMETRFAPDGTSLAVLGDGPIRLYRLPARPPATLVFGWATAAALAVLLLVRSKPRPIGPPLG